MRIVANSVGLDYHDASVQVCVLSPTGELLGNARCRNDRSSIVSYAEGFGAVGAAAMESCTGAADLAEELVSQAGWSVSLGHPGYVRRMKQNPDKTDYGDARMLADLVRVGYLPRVWLAPQEVRELRRLVRYRQQLADERRNVKLRIRALLRDHRVPPGPRSPWSRAWRAWLKDLSLGSQSDWVMARHLRRLESLTLEVREAEARLAEVTAEDVVVSRLLTLPGIGLVTACALRAEIGRFDRFRSGKQLARFCGLTPRNASSGQRQADAGLIRAGNPQLRAVLIEAAQRLMRWDPRWSALGRRLRGRGKPYNVAAAAVGNRWVRWMYQEMRTIEQAA